MAKENLLTYAIRNVEKIVWDLNVSSNGLTSTYSCSNVPVYVPYGEYKNVIIGDCNIVLVVVKSAFSDKILTRQISNSVVFYDNTPIVGESIIITSLNKEPIIIPVPNSVNKYYVYFQNDTTIDGRADFSESLGHFANWSGSSVVEYKDNNKYITVKYAKYLGAVYTK